MAEGVVEVAFDPQQPERRYNPDVVGAVIDQTTGQPVAIITPDTFRRAAIELGMDEAKGSRAYSLIARHFSHEGMEIHDPWLGVRADRLPGLVDDLREDRTNIKNLGVRSMELLEHLLGKLYLPEDV